MANPSNLLRPPILNNPTPPPQTNTPNPPAAPGNTINMSELQATITSIVTQVLSSQAKDLVRTYLNPNAELTTAKDQTIEAQYRNNLSELDKIPDIVRCLREFSGNPGEFSSWRKSVERVLQIYESCKGTPKYYGILSVIRNKIVGNADIALESYNTPLDWKAICRCLTIHYADKRDLSTLEYQLTSLIQGRASVQEYYQKIYSHLSLILNKISCMEIGDESMRLLTETYRDKALDTFIRGLNGDLPRLLGIKEPVDLPQALHFCLKLENQNFRANYANNYHGNIKKSQHYPPPVPSRNIRQPHLNHNETFHPNLAYLPKPGFINYSDRQQTFRPSNQAQQPQHAPQRPFAPKPQPRPEPMEIDQSIQTKAVNYANKPQPMQYAGKRPPADSSIRRPIHPQKMQRNYHIDTNTEDCQPPQELETTDEYREAQLQADNENAYNQTLAEYSDEYFSEQNLESESSNLADIHFLG